MFLNAIVSIDHRTSNITFLLGKKLSIELFVCSQNAPRREDSQINMTGMIVEIVEKHPKTEVTNMGVAPANFTPLKVTTELLQSRGW